MTEPALTRAKVERQLTGEPIWVGERSIRPIARVAGSQVGGGDETGSGIGAWLRVTPIEVLVRESDGNEYCIPIADPTREAMRGIVLSALLVAAVCWFLMALLRWRRA